MCLMRWCEITMRICPISKMLESTWRRPRRFMKYGWTQYTMMYVDCVMLPVLTVNCLLTLQNLTKNSIHVELFLAENVSNSTNESIANNDKNCDESPIKNGVKKRPRKKRIQNINIGGPRQINAPFSLIPLSDDLSYRLNQISGDISDSKRLFTTVLPTKNSFLQLISKEKFINTRVYEPIEVNQTKSLTYITTCHILR